MSSQDFRSLQKQHEGLLQKQSGLSDTDKEGFTQEVNQYIEQAKSAGANISSIEEREQLRANLRYWANYIYRIDGVLPDTDLPETIVSKKMLPANIYKSLAIPIVILAIVILLLIVVVPKISDTQQAAIVQTLTAQLTTTPSILRYDFEDGPQGWVYQTFADSQAISRVQQSSEYTRFGKSSLELQVDLIGKNQQKSNGEAFVDFSNNPPAGETVPLDFNGKPIIMWVYVPSSAIGDPRAPDAIQVFVKDMLYRSQYSEWMRLTRSNTNQWIPISMTPTDQEVKDYETDLEFDPTRIKILGFKIGSHDRSTARFTGSIWIDGVYWP